MLLKCGNLPWNRHLGLWPGQRIIWIALYPFITLNKYHFRVPCASLVHVWNGTFCIWWEGRVWLLYLHHTCCVSQQLFMSSDGCWALWMPLGFCSWVQCKLRNKHRLYGLTRINKSHWFYEFLTYTGGSILKNRALNSAVYSYPVSGTQPET